MITVFQSPNQLVPAQRWGKDFGTRPDISIKVESKLHDMRMADGL